MRGNFKHQIRLAKSELRIIKREQSQWIRVPVDRGTCIKPMNQLLFFYCGQPRDVFDRFTNMWIDLARRHPPGHNDFAHHWRPPLDHRVTGHRPRRDGPIVMAGDAIVFENRDDVFGVRNGLLQMLVTACESNPAAR